MHEQRKWYLEADTALGEGAMKTGDMTAKGLEHNINSGEKRSRRRQRASSSLERSSAAGKNAVKGHCMRQRNLWKEEPDDVANLTVVFFSEIAPPTPTFSNHHPDQQT